MNQILKRKYDPNIDYLKAVGIILMVYGHTFSNVPYVFGFVLMFHMPLFFFASGFCLKSSYLESPIAFVRKRLKGLWWPFVKWECIFILLHNILFRLHLYGFHSFNKYGATHLYTTKEILNNVLSVIFRMDMQEGLLGGYWFLKALFWASLISLFIIILCRKKLMGGAVALLFVLCIANHYCKVDPLFHLNAQPLIGSLFFISGYVFASKKIKPLSYKWIVIVLLLTFVGSLFFGVSLGHDFYDNKLMIPYIPFAIMSTWAIYSLFYNLNIQGRFASCMKFIGENTLTILTWHFLTFKFVSILIVRIYHLQIERLSEFPLIMEYSQRGWWAVYFVVALILTCLVGYCNKWIKIYWLKL